MTAETPRTDAALKAMAADDVEQMCQISTLARELERDLAAAREQIADAERSRDHWHECFTVLERAIVGDTGASAITTAQRLRARVAELETLLWDACPNPSGINRYNEPAEWWDKRRALLAPSPEPKP